jgi:hypothetical protein
VSVYRACPIRGIKINGAGEPAVGLACARHVSVWTLRTDLAVDQGHLHLAVRRDGQPAPTWPVIDQFEEVFAASGG